ncbi:disease resistance protein RGA2-like isoform X2 [Cornus florida]|uniref:disease resistance protein RGA2-like isoform X2 n=1 Tax=Cornus florida TaxID=4283 RepID=UPI00289E0F98|nr:disease resistance protein RGA2-like isoform X2 [Cornus florida]
MAETLLTEIVKKLGSALLQEMGLVWGVKDELEKLINTVSTIGAALADAEEQQLTNHEVEDWLHKLNDATQLRRQAMTPNTRLKKGGNMFFRPITQRLENCIQTQVWWVKNGNAILCLRIFVGFVAS